MSDKDLSRLERRIGYQFTDKNLLTLALTHRSFKGPNNERLEYLGDSILSFIIAEHLYQRFPKAKEGQMSRLRASLVKGVTLGKLGKEFELGDYLRLGAGELKSGGFRRESILADAVESILGAIYLDSSHEQCRKTVLQWYDSRLDGLTLEGTVKDPKTRLQEYLQSFKKSLPDYQVTEIKGEAHDQVFSVCCVLSDYKIETKGSGSSRRFAEQEAAEAALKLLEVKVSD